MSFRIFLISNRILAYLASHRPSAATTLLDSRHAESQNARFMSFEPEQPVE